MGDWGSDLPSPQQQYVSQQSWQQDPNQYGGAAQRNPEPWDDQEQAQYDSPASRQYSQQAPQSWQHQYYQPQYGQPQFGQPQYGQYSQPFGNGDFRAQSGYQPQFGQQYPMGRRNAQPSQQDRSLLIGAFVFMIISIISTVAYAVINASGSHSFSIVLFVILLIPLAWLIPMLVIVNKIKAGLRPNTTSFAVAVLLFGNLIAGILLLIAKKDA